MDLIKFTIMHDWPVLVPILICSVVAVAITLERIWYFRRHRAGSEEFILTFQDELQKGLPQAKDFAERHKGLLPRVASMAVRSLEQRPDRFEQLFEVSSSLASRQLERGLTMMGTIATISPYLGLFGTVVRILLTFGDMANMSSGGDTNKIMAGIGSALIATAFGLAVAIYAVSVNNYLYTLAGELAKDFELIKLACLSAGPGPQPNLSRRSGRIWADEERQI
ncbi:MAG: hypothetical protein AMXMBFR84_41190 [Candidatus Hydrogenedentota bacterium]